MNIRLPYVEEAVRIKKVKMGFYQECHTPKQLHQQSQGLQYQEFLEEKCSASPVNKRNFRNFSMGLSDEGSEPQEMKVKFPGETNKADTNFTNYQEQQHPISMKQSANAVHPQQRDQSAFKQAKNSLGELCQQQNILNKETSQSRQQLPKDQEMNKKTLFANQPHLKPVPTGERVLFQTQEKSPMNLSPQKFFDLRKRVQRNYKPHHASSATRGSEGDPTSSTPKGSQQKKQQLLVPKPPKTPLPQLAKKCQALKGSHSPVVSQAIDEEPDNETFSKLHQQNRQKIINDFQSSCCSPINGSQRKAMKRYNYKVVIKEHREQQMKFFS